MDFSKTFKDTLGREWTPRLDLLNIDEFEAEFGPIDRFVPSLPMDGKEANDQDIMPLAQFLGDLRRVFDVFYFLIKPQAEAKGLDKKAVKAGMGDEIVAANMGIATLRAFHDFFPMDPNRRSLLQRVATLGQKTMNALTKRIGKELEKIDPERIISEMPELNADELHAKLSVQFAKPATGVSATSA